MSEIIGEIENYFSKVGVAVLNVTQGTVNIGDTISIKGATTDIEMTVESMQIDRADIYNSNTYFGIEILNISNLL